MQEKPMATAGKDEKAKKEGPKELNFSWEGKNKQGKVVRGEIRAASEAAANAALRRQGITVTKLKKQKTGGGGSVTDKDITLFLTPTRHHGEVRRAPAAVFRHRRQGYQQPGLG
jgi:hypothetical protein